MDFRKNKNESPDSLPLVTYKGTTAAGGIFQRNTSIVADPQVIN